jgi:PLP dependent protein
LSLSAIESNLEKVGQRLADACQRAGRAPSEVTLIAVSKTVGSPEMLEAYQFGIRHFGENRVQEAEKKWPGLGHLEPAPVRHLIGHLQSNKIKAALKNFDIIHSIDTVTLAESINRHTNQRLAILLEINVSGEASKYGFKIDEIAPAYEKIQALKNLEVKGLMTVAPACSNPEEVRPIFRRLRQLRDKMGVIELSMGMTDDFEVAVEEGATMIRVGRAIFGENIP